MHALTRPSREGGNLLFNTSDDHIIASCCPILKRCYHESRCPVRAGHADATKNAGKGFMDAIRNEKLGYWHIGIVIMSNE